MKTKSVDGLRTFPSMGICLWNYPTVSLELDFTTGDNREIIVITERIVQHGWIFFVTSIFPHDVRQTDLIPTAVILHPIPPQVHHFDNLGLFIFPINDTGFAKRVCFWKTLLLVKIQLFLKQFGIKVAFETEFGFFKDRRGAHVPRTDKILIIRFDSVKYIGRQNIDLGVHVKALVVLRQYNVRLDFMKSAIARRIKFAFH